MALPNPSMSFSPFAILTAEEMNDLVENIEYLEDKKVTNSMLDVPWTDFTPTVTVKASMTISGLTVSWAKYREVGKKVEIDMQLVFTLGGTISNEIYVTPPVMWDTDVYGSSSFNAGQWFGTVGSGSAWSLGMVYGFSNDKLNFLTQGSGNFSAGSGRVINYRGEYIIA